MEGDYLQLYIFDSKDNLHNCESKDPNKQSEIYVHIANGSVYLHPRKIPSISHNPEVPWILIPYQCC